jgi:hypothetical protein
LTSRPPRLISPLSGSSSPAISRRSVDFPQPDAPTIAKNSPGSMSSVIPSTATLPAKDFCNRFRLMDMKALLFRIGDVGVGSLLVEPLTEANELSQGGAFPSLELRLR